MWKINRTFILLFRQYKQALLGFPQKTIAVVQYNQQALKQGRNRYANRVWQSSEKLEWVNSASSVPSG